MRYPVMQWKTAFITVLAIFLSAMRFGLGAAFDWLNLAKRA